MQRFILVVKGPNLNDVQTVELLRMPVVGAPIETRFGTCIVTAAEPLPPGGEYAGRITCRLP